MKPSRRWGLGVPALVLILLLICCSLWCPERLHFLNFLFSGAALPELGPEACLLQVALFGFFASFHCIGMCSGTVMSLAAGEQPWKRELLFHAGRILCCTVIGAVLGAIGRAVSLNVYLRALIPLLCAIMMAAMALQMLGFLRWLQIGLGTGVAARLCRHGNSSAFVLGILTALLPCGMLQTVQLYALGSENIRSGMMIMLVFGVCSTPVLLAFGVLAGKLNGMRQKTLTVLSAMLILWMAVRMAMKGLRLMGVIP